MVSLAEYKAAYAGFYARMTRVKNLASALKDGRYGFHATSFRLDIEKYMSQIEKVYQLYTTAPSYKSKDFTDYVKKLEADVSYMEERLKKETAISNAQR